MGDWRSWLARLHGMQKVTGSNPVFSTAKGKKHKVRGKIIFTFYLIIFYLFYFLNMLGAIIGDIVGSRYEFANIHTTDFELFTPYNDFTDDTICTITIADALLEGKPFKDSLLVTTSPSIVLPYGRAITSTKPAKVQFLKLLPVFWKAMILRVLYACLSP